ncbi:MAG: hypothetical protein R3B91_16320 [Planctomycetaceae bacterium]
MLDQLDEATLAGVLGNCGSLLSMTVGPRDAGDARPLLGQGLTPTDLMQIPQYHGYIRLLTDSTPHVLDDDSPAPVIPPATRPTSSAVSPGSFGQSLTKVA